MTPVRRKGGPETTRAPDLSAGSPRTSVRPIGYSAFGIGCAISFTRSANTNSL